MMRRRRSDIDALQDVTGDEALETRLWMMRRRRQYILRRSACPEGCRDSHYKVTGNDTSDAVPVLRGGVSERDDEAEPSSPDDASS
jgi:hypothetical protein